MIKVTRNKINECRLMKKKLSHEIRARFKFIQLAVVLEKGFEYFIAVFR